jgi:cytochrome P450
MAFAIQEAMIVLANLLRAFRFDLVEGRPVMPQQRVTLRPRGGMKMHAKRRNSPMTSTAEKFFAKER